MGRRNNTEGTLGLGPGAGDCEGQDLGPESLGKKLKCIEPSVLEESASLCSRVAVRIVGGVSLSFRPPLLFGVDP